MRRVWCVLAIAALTGCGGVRDMFSAHVDVAASVGNRDLGAQRMADLFVHSRALSIQSDVMVRVAHLWVNYLLFADRVLAGDSLLDSASVLASNWPAVHQAMISRLHDKLAAERQPLDSAGLDSVFAAGDLRLVRHILIRTNDSMSTAQLETKRRQAERIRDQLAGGVPWERANAANEDPSSKAQQGDLGVIARGEMVEPFELAAFALPPGALAPVTQTAFGFHVIRRPALPEVRDAYRRGVEERLMARFDSTYLDAMLTRRHLAVRSSAPAAVREVARDPIAARQSHRALSTFDGGRLTEGDLARWLDVIQPRAVQQISGASDDDLRGFVRALSRNEVLYVEAQQAGIGLTDAEFGQLRASLASEIDTVRALLRLDSLAPGDTAGARQRAEFARVRVDQFLDRMVENPQVTVPVPGALADRLREGAAWRVYSAGVQRAFDLARLQKSALDSAAGRLAPPATRPQ